MVGGDVTIGQLMKDEQISFKEAVGVAMRLREETEAFHWDHWEERGEQAPKPAKATAGKRTREPKADEADDRDVIGAGGSSGSKGPKAADAEKSAKCRAPASKAKPTASEGTDTARTDNDTASKGDGTSKKVVGKSKAKDTTSKDTDTTSKDKDTTSKAKDTTSKAKDTTSKAKDTTSKAKDTTSKAKDTVKLKLASPRVVPPADKPEASEADAPEPSPQLVAFWDKYKVSNKPVVEDPVAETVPEPMLDDASQDMEPRLRRGRATTDLSESLIPEGCEEALPPVAVRRGWQLVWHNLVQGVTHVHIHVYIIYLSSNTFLFCSLNYYVTQVLWYFACSRPAAEQATWPGCC